MEVVEENVLESTPNELSYIIGVKIGYALSVVAQIKDKKRREELERILYDIYDYVYKLVAACK